ncbi:tyrosine-type recombinase/integrase [Paracoccus aminophilus]|uniref:Phage integrase n=1 Tax=Paracoccus aminophilus JCM 7686 TaxID=1367847 RepID=S5XWN9_PARAH|nr:site-specific integrase [Paracoccus aminophilus]AGT09712.1 phage integrase [Paracoccus aminophilus JCM 7686]
MPHRPKGTRFWHYDFQVRGLRFHGSCGTEDYEEAKAVEAAERVKARNAPEVTGRFSISQALGTYWTDVCQHQPSARTARSQAKMILSVIEGSQQMDEITNASLMRYVAMRRATVSNATVNRELQMLARSMRHMVSIHGAEMPKIDFKTVQTAEPEERVRELTPEEQSKLFKHLRPDLGPFVTFALLTGARLSTITELEWSHIDQANKRMMFHLKGGGTMKFPISKEIAALLADLPRSELPDHSRYVFTFEVQNRKNQRRKIVPNGGGIMEEFRAALAAAEIHDFRFHDLRHTFATRLLRHTGNLKLVSRLLGHSNVETTARYAHVLDNDLADALDSVSMMGVSRRKSRRKQ